MSLTSRQQFWLRTTAWGMAGLCAVYVLAVPVVLEIAHGLRDIATDRGLDRLTLPNAILVRAMEVFMSGWFFVLGATVGSFLNVVVYRLPAGISLISERSRCPACRTPIAGRDNIPVLGWLKLSGRCRACGVAISARYPIVEFLTGMVFLLLYFVQLISGGANLPVREPNLYAGVIWILFYTKWDLVALYLFHCCGFCVLLTWSLTALDGNRFPLRASLSCLAVAVLWPALSPGLLPLQADADPLAAYATPQAGSAILTSACGIGAGILASLALLPVMHPVQPAGAATASELTVFRGEATVYDTASALLIAGAVFGWQALVAIVTLSLLLRLMFRPLESRWPALQHWPLAGWIFAAGLLHHLLWRTAVKSLSPWYPGPESTALQSLLLPGFACLLIVVDWIIRRTYTTLRSSPI